MKKIEVECPECGHRIVTTDEDFFSGLPMFDHQTTHEPITNR